MSPCIAWPSAPTAPYPRTLNPSLAPAQQDLQEGMEVGAGNGLGCSYTQAQPLQVLILDSSTCPCPLCPCGPLSTVLRSGLTRCFPAQLTADLHGTQQYPHKPIST